MPRPEVEWLWLAKVATSLAVSASTPLCDSLVRRELLPAVHCLIREEQPGRHCVRGAEGTKVGGQDLTPGHACSLSSLGQASPPSWASVPSPVSWDGCIQREALVHTCMYPTSVGCTGYLRKGSRPLISSNVWTDLLENSNAHLHCLPWFGVTHLISYLPKCHTGVSWISRTKLILLQRRKMPLRSLFIGSMLLLAAIKCISCVYSKSCQAGV